jgi:hypothetical protein
MFSRPMVCYCQDTEARMEGVKIHAITKSISQEQTLKLFGIQAVACVHARTRLQREVANTATVNAIRAGNRLNLPDNGPRLNMRLTPSSSISPSSINIGSVTLGWC